MTEIYASDASWAGQLGRYWERHPIMDVMYSNHTIHQHSLWASCLYFSTDSPRLSCVLWSGLPSIHPCYPLDDVLCCCGAIFKLLPFLEHLVQHALWYMLWPLLLSGLSLAQGNYVHHDIMPLSNQYIKQIQCYGSLIVSTSPPAS